jgi:hypothetical protein
MDTPGWLLLLLLLLLHAALLPLPLPLLVVLKGVQSLIVVSTEPVANLQHRQRSCEGFHEHVYLGMHTAYPTSG